MRRRGRPTRQRVAREQRREEFYVCPQHTGTGGYESCCVCDGWKKGDPNFGRECTEARRDE